MRRLTGLLLALSMFQLTTLDVRTECDRHAQASAAPIDVHAGHVMGAAHREAPPEQDGRDVNAPAPKCCMVAGTCGGSAFASIVFAADVDVTDGAGLRSAVAKRPPSPAFSPETPPPRA